MCCGSKLVTNDPNLVNFLYDKVFYITKLRHALSALLYWGLIVSDLFCLRKWSTLQAHGAALYCHWLYVDLPFDEKLCMRLGLTPLMRISFSLCHVNQALLHYKSLHFITRVPYRPPHCCLTVQIPRPASCLRAVLVVPAAPSRTSSAASREKVWASFWLQSPGQLAPPQSCWSSHLRHSPGSCPQLWDTCGVRWERM